MMIALEIFQTVVCIGVVAIGVAMYKTEWN